MVDRRQLRAPPSSDSSLHDVDRVAAAGAGGVGEAVGSSAVALRAPAYGFDARYQIIMAPGGVDCKSWTRSASEEAEKKLASRVN